MKALRVFSMALLGGAALFCVFWAIVALVQGSYSTALVALGGAVFVIAALSAWIIMPTVEPRGSADAAGTTVRIDARVDVLLFVCVVAGTIAMGSFSVLGAMGRLQLPLPKDIGSLYALVFLGPTGVFLVATWLTIRRRGMGYVRLTLDGFEFVEAFSAKRGAWSQVVGVTDEVPDGPQAKSPLVMLMADGRKVILKESALYTPGGRALLSLMRFYWQHPGDRAEFTDGRALERLHNIHVELGPGMA